MVDPIIGWRAWTLVRSYGEWVLKSPDLGGAWNPGQDMRTSCDTDHQDQASREKCNCGFNAFASQKLLVDHGYNKHTVVGEVEMWGEVTSPHG